MFKFITGLSSSVFLYIILGLLIALGVSGGIIKYQSSKIDSLNETIGGYKTAESGYKAAIAKANKSIDEYEAESKKREEDSKKASEAIKPVVAKHEAAAIRILTTKPKSDNACKEANDLFNEYLLERNK